MEKSSKSGPTMSPQWLLNAARMIGNLLRKNRDMQSISIAAVDTGGRFRITAEDRGGITFLDETFKI